MKRILLIALALVSGICSAQTFKVQNLDVLGTSTLTGLASFTVRPQFNGATPWDSGNLANPAFSTTGNLVKFSWATPTGGQLGLTIDATYEGFLWHSGNLNPALLAPLASPALTGTPTSPTPSLGTNSTQIATTAFVVASQPCANLMLYGGDNTGSVNNDTAFANAIGSEASSSQKCVYLPRGIYLFSSSGISYSTNGTSLTIRGDGPNVSLMQFAAGAGISVTTTGGTITAHIRDLSILTAGAGGGTVGLNFNNTASTGGPQPQEQSDVTNVTLRGSDGYNATNYWSDAIAVNNWSQWNFTNVYVSGGSGFSGVAVNLTASNPPNAIVYNFQACTFNFVGTGISYGNFIQGVTVNQSNFDTTFGINVPSGESGLDQLVVSNSQFGIGTSAGIGIQVASLVPNTQILGNLFIIPGTANGISLSNTGLFSIVGNSFNEGSGATGINGVGIASTNGTLPGVITGNIFNGMVGGSGIALFSTSNHVNVQSNVYLGNGTNVSNSCGATCTVGGGSP